MKILKIIIIAILICFFGYGEIYALSPKTAINTNRRAIEQLYNQIVLDVLTGQLYMEGTTVEIEGQAVVVRHGQTDGNKRNVMQGQVDGKENQLNSVGKHQSKITAKNIFIDLKKRCGLERLISLAKSNKLVVLQSPLGRSRETAMYFTEYFYEQTGLRLNRTDEQLVKEINFGTADGKSLEDLESLKADDIIKMVLLYRKNQDSTIDWKTGESFLDLAIRAVEFAKKLNAMHAEDSERIFIIFTHGTFISALRSVIGDKLLLSEDGMIAFREHLLENATPFWLPSKYYKNTNNDFIGQSL